MDNGHSFDVIYTDFAKAFDSVAHERLLLKVEAMGIKGDLLKWIRSFLTDRTQCVKVEGVTSGWKKVTSGIPQGSVLGPLLFVCFINDMPDSVKHNICRLFADDCKLYGATKEAAENDGLTENDLQTDFTGLENWSGKWQLPFNAPKCKVMHFGKNNPRRPYRMNGHTLEITDQEKDLGVMIDEELKFHVHTAAAAKKGNQMLGIIKKSYCTRDAKTMTSLYTAMVRPLLEYGNAIWGPHYKTDIKRIEQIQRRATKIVVGLHDESYEDRLKALKLPSLVYRRRRGDMIQMFKIMNGLVRLKIRDLFTPIENSSTRGHSRRVRKGKAVKHQRQSSFSQRVINDWNSLPAGVIEASTVNDFKNRLDEHWISHKYEIGE